MGRVAGLFVELFWQIVEAHPALSVLNVFQLLHNFVLRVAGVPHRQPKLNELLFRDHSVVVDVDLVEKLVRGDFAERTLPVLESLVFVDRVAVVDVEDAEHFAHLLHALLRQLVRLYIKTSVVRQHMRSEILQKGSRAACSYVVGVAI